MTPKHSANAIIAKLYDEGLSIIKVYLWDPECDSEKSEAADSDIGVSPYGPNKASIFFSHKLAALFTVL